MHSLLFPIFLGIPIGDGLKVIQTPKGVDLREAIWEADAIERQPNDRRAISTQGTSFLFHGLASPTKEQQKQQGRQYPPLSPWEALISNLTSAEGISLPSPVPSPVRLSDSEAQQAQQAGPEELELDLGPGQAARPSSASFVTPPPIPALPAAKGPPLATTTQISGKFSLPPLELPTEISEPLLTEAHSSSSPIGYLLSPAPLLTPGAPPSVPLELRAEAAERLWPLLAPFAPRILRDDILLPAAERRFIQPENRENSGSFGRRTPLENSHMPASHWMPAGLRMDSEIRPASYIMEAAMAVADVSGFTALTEVLSRVGPSGVELLTRCMNSYFAQVIDVVTQHGGDVVKFAGDAMIIVFEPTNEEKEAGEDGGLGAATWRAAAASLELIDKYGAFVQTREINCCFLPFLQIVLTK